MQLLPNGYVLEFLYSNGIIVLNLYSSKT